MSPDRKSFADALDIVFVDHQFGRRVDLVRTGANGQPAFGAYVHAPTGIRHATGLFVLTLAGDKVCAMTRFENTVLARFGLPLSLPLPSR